jgi:hypothetical protein
MWDVVCIMWCFVCSVRAYGVVMATAGHNVAARSVLMLLVLGHCVCIEKKRELASVNETLRCRFKGASSM